MSNEPSHSSSKLGLDRDRSVVEKLFRTVILLLLGGFFGIFSALAITLIKDPWARFAVQSVLEVCWVFWFFALVFVWWMPRWLRTRYLHAETRMLYLAKVLKYLVIILIVFSVVFITYLVQIGVLPAEPK